MNNKSDETAVRVNLQEFPPGTRIEVSVVELYGEEYVSSYHESFPGFQCNVAAFLHPGEAEEEAMFLDSSLTASGRRLSQSYRVGRADGIVALDGRVFLVEPITCQVSRKVRQAHQKLQSSGLTPEDLALLGYERKTQTSKPVSNPKPGPLVRRSWDPGGGDWGVNPDPKTDGK